MFERYTEAARRVVFWARLEAGRSGSAAIQPEHLLFGFLVEDQQLSESEIAPYFGKYEVPIPQKKAPRRSILSSDITSRLFDELASVANRGEPKPDTLDLSITKGTLTALAAARERAGVSNVDLPHILWGLLSDPESSISKQLTSNGVTAAQIEDAIRDRGGQSL